jgi:23S rRNA A1618 N6-methylase RlmF
MKRKQKKNTKNQWIKELVIWKDKEDPQLLAKLTKIKREEIQINKIRDELFIRQGINIQDI